MKSHIRKVRGIWAVRECIRGRGGRYCTLGGPIGHGYTVREAYEDWRIQMEAQRA